MKARPRARGLFRRLPREMDEGKAFRDMGIVDAVPVEGPAGVGMDAGPAAAQRFEPRKVHPPDVAFPRRKRAALGEGLETRPRDGDLRRPAAVDVAAVVQGPVHVDRGAEARAIPVHERPALAAGVASVTARILEAAEDVDLPRMQVEITDGAVLRCGKRGFVRLRRG